MTTRPLHSLTDSSTGEEDVDHAHDHDAHTQLRDAAAAIAAAVNSTRNAQGSATAAVHHHPSSYSRPDLTSENSSAAAPSLPSSTRPPFPEVQFRSHTIAPSPPHYHQAVSSSEAALPTPKLVELTTTAATTTTHTDVTPTSPYPRSPLSGGHIHRLRTDLHPPTPITPIRTDNLARPSLNLQHKTSASSLRPISRTPSLKAAAFVFGPASAASSTVASPIIAAMGDVTPLPSPLLAGDSPGPWKHMRPSSRDANLPFSISPDSVLVTSTGESIATAMAFQTKRRTYAALTPGSTLPEDESVSGNGPANRPPPVVHTRNRSTSEYIPDPMLIPKRMVTVSGSHVQVDTAHMRREPHLSEARGLTPIEKPPTPPPSESSLSAADSYPSAAGSGSSAAGKKSRSEFFEAYGRYDGKRRRWRAVKMLGQGTFSRVMLATSQISSSEPEDEELASTADVSSPKQEPPRRTLVAVKVCEHGPRGGASEDRIEMSLKRELEIMQSIDHPSLVHLTAWNIEPTRAILVLSYCPGGDLFDVASSHRAALTPPLLRRIFAELVGAVRYLHERRIVHRDIKLENVLVNLAPSELLAPDTDWITYPRSVITLTDLGLSRRIADDEKLETRCGSDDYAAPEVIMGQPYDGRATDAWSLGVLLFALLESRLPFDPPPGIGDHAMQMRLRSRTSHRIARAEWRWIEYGVAENMEGEGDHEADLSKFEAKGLRGAMEVVEGLLKRARSRWPMSKVASTGWVSGGIQVQGGITYHEEEEAEEVL